MDIDDGPPPPYHMDTTFSSTLPRYSPWFYTIRG